MGRVSRAFPVPRARDSVRALSTAPRRLKAAGVTMTELNADLLPLLQRIAAALERLAPAPAPPADLDAADAFIWHADPGWLEPVARGQPHRDRPVARHRPGARHFARKHPSLCRRPRRQQRAAVGRARHRQELAGQGRSRRGQRRAGARAGPRRNSPRRHPEPAASACRWCGIVRAAACCSATIFPSTGRTRASSR